MATRIGTAALLLVLTGPGGCKQASTVRPEAKSDSRSDSKGDSKGDSKVAPKVRAIAKLQARLKLPNIPANGLSGFGRGADGSLWAVPERDRFMLQLRVDSNTVSLAQPPIPMAGPKTGIDTESLAVLGAGRFALGTESQDPKRSTDDVLLVEVKNKRVRIIERIPLDYDEMWGFHAAVNRGIEGLCYTGNRILLAVETVIEEKGKRFGPVASYEMTSKRWTPYRVPLSSSSGKLSSLACKIKGEHIEVMAIERDYGIARLLAFELPSNGDRRALTARMVADLSIVPGIPNMEGLAPLPNGDVLVLIDNHSGGVTGPNELLLIALPR